MKALYFACEVNEDIRKQFLNAQGVKAAEFGFAAAGGEHVAAALKISYDPKKTDIGSVIGCFVNAVQADERGMKNVCLYYDQGEDLPQIEYYSRFCQMRGAEPAAALGTLIVNDSMLKEHAPSRVSVDYKRLTAFTAAGGK